MTDIPEQVTLPIGNLQRSALKSLMDHAPHGYPFEELLQLVFVKGLASLVKGRRLERTHTEVLQRAEADLPQGTGGTSEAPRLSADYLGFFIEADAERALQELAAQHPFVDEDELSRIVFSAGLRALPNDDGAQRSLMTAVWVKTDGSIR